jgi:hypothetical protein
MSGFPNPWAQANANIESWLWLTDHLLSSAIAAIFLFEQARPDGWRSLPCGSR